MKVTGAQYLDLNPDVKAVGVDPLYHFLTYVCPVGPLREPRIIDYVPPPALPENWDWQKYVNAHKDLRDAGINMQAKAEAHYLNHGYKEPGRWPVPPLPDEYPTVPKDWEDAAYLFRFKDKQPPIADSEYAADPLKHWYDWGRAAGWQWKPEGWSSAQYMELNTDVKSAPLLHWWVFGEAEGRRYRKFQPPQAPGLHLILDIANSKRCLFTGMRFNDGLLLGDYGLHVGGAKIQFYDGDKLVDEATLTDPLGESIFHLIAADDGVPIASCEHFGMMYRRDGNPWRQTQASIVYEDLAFGIFRLGGNLYCLVCSFRGKDSYILRSSDNGKTWQKTHVFTGGWPQMGCGNSDGVRILLAGSENDSPVIRDVNKTVVARRGDISGKGYTQLCGKNGAWNFAGDSWIDYWESGTPRTVFQSSRQHAMWLEVGPDGTRIALFSAWDQTDYGDAQVAISRDNGQSWSQLCMVPCPCLLGTHFADGGVYLFGGKYREYGRVYFYKF